MEIAKLGVFSFFKNIFEISIFYKDCATLLSKIRKIVQVFTYPRKTSAYVTISRRPKIFNLILFPKLKKKAFRWVSN